MSAVKKREFKPLPRFEDMGPSVPPFLEYFERHIDEIKRVQLLLETKLSEHPGLLEEQFREAESHYGRMTSILAWAESYLDLAERGRLVPRDADFTDMDREVEMKAACARERRFRDIVSGLCEAIKMRVSVCQTLLKGYREEKRIGV